MVGLEGLGAGRLRGLMIVTTMEWTRVVDTMSLRGPGGREAGRSGRIGDGENRGLVAGRRVVGQSDPSRSRLRTCGMR